MLREPTYIDEDGGGVLVAQGSRRTQRSALCRDGRDERAGGTGGEYPGEKHFRHDLNSSRGSSHASHPKARADMGPCRPLLDISETFDAKSWCWGEQSLNRIPALDP